MLRPCFVNLLLEIWLGLNHVNLLIRFLKVNFSVVLTCKDRCPCSLLMPLSTDNTRTCSLAWNVFQFLITFHIFKILHTNQGYHLFLQLRYLYHSILTFKIYHILSCSLPCIFVSCHQPSYFPSRRPRKKEAEIIDSMYYCIQMQIQ